VPVKLLEDSDRYVSFENEYCEAAQLQTVPCSLFDDSDRYCRPDMTPHNHDDDDDDDNDPDSWLLDRSKYDRPVRFPRDVGIVPDRLLLCRYRT
jgi:hypothetical protein